MATRGAAEDGRGFAALRAGDRKRRQRGQASAGDRAPKAGASAAPVMEIEIGNAHMWVWHDADIGLAAAIVRALQTASRTK